MYILGFQSDAKNRNVAPSTFGGCLIFPRYGVKSKVAASSNFLTTKYHKIPIISPELIFVQMAFLVGLFSGSLFLEGLTIGGNFAFQMSWT